MMLGEKVASSPALAPIEGWSTEDTSLSEDEVAALHLAMGVGMSASVSANGQEEQPERHTLPDLSALPQQSNGAIMNSMDPKSSVVRLQPVLEAHENGSLASGDSDDREHLSSKAASFYIGGDDGTHARDGRVFSPRESVSSPLPSVGSPRLSVMAAKTKPIPFTPPDGGYGWVVALSACFINVWIVGFIKSYGVIYVAVRNAFPEASAYHASWLPSLLSTVGLLIAPVTGVLCRRFTSRKVSFLGGFLCFLGLLLGSFATSMNQLIFSIGFLTGLGAGLTTTPGVLIVSLYFEKRRAFASAICVSGNALGGFLLPLLADFLLDQYGLRGTFLILAGLQLHICAASMLYRPISHHALIQAKERQNQADEDVGKNKLLPSFPASPWRQSAQDRVKSTPASRSKALWNKISRKHTTTTDFRQEELHRQVSFLRTASMMNSIPDLTHYARSWSVSGRASPSLDSRPLEANDSPTGSRSSLFNRTGSKLSIMRLPLFAEHPSVLRLSSEEEGVGTPTSAVHRGSFRRSSLSRTALGQDARPSLTRQSSVRVPQSRIMESVQEAENDEHVVQESASLVSDTAKDTQKESKPEEDKDIQPAKPDEGPRGCCRLCGVCTDLCDPLLLRNGLFWAIAISVVLMACGAPFTLFYVPAYAESVNIPTSYIPTILSLSSVFDLIGRLGTGFISDLGFFKLHHIYFICSLAAGVSVLMVPLGTTFIGLTAVLAVYGFGVGSWFVMVPPILAQHHGASHLAASYGLVRLFNGLMNFVSPQMTGVLFDATGSYLALYLLMGCSMVAGSLLVAITVPLIHHCRSRFLYTNASPLPNSDEESC